ncbi:MULTISPECIES: phosphohydrolase [unclassified Dysgonomonas]|uniref:phosphohydrolase n=1 Tax=unclassified Dysgonomonas TaxID=2630389 RepID=UPI0025BFB791|nr:MULTISPECIES: phosphohydrolase [unclassified Dysgonomonas]HMM02016.1 phosphohydrolase [Dysgonomonas sp.]
MITPYKTNTAYPNTIRTFSGKYMNVFAPTIDMICIEDIAHALSMLCRFGGHTSEFYSVAQHSILCADLVAEPYKLEALLHDAAEAYLVDLPSPIKHRMSEYKTIEDNLMKVIAKKFNLAYPFPEAIHKADKDMLKYEWDSLIEGFNKFIIPWSHMDVKNEFLSRYNIYKR